MQQSYNDLIEVVKNATNRIEENAQKIYDLKISVLSEQLNGQLKLQGAKIDEIHRVLTENGLIKTVEHLKNRVNSFEPIAKVFWLVVSALSAGITGLFAKVIFWTE